MFYSQAGQDLWVLQTAGNKGFFVDIGAHDGIESSNTYALEKHGWTGICVEPNPVSFAALRNNRSCDCHNIFAGEHSAIPGLPAFIDYLSIDVDGDELGVLKGFDFGNHKVRLITIEHNQYLEGSDRQQQIYDYLSRRGFRRSHRDVRCLDVGYFGCVYEDWYENNIFK